MLLGLSPSLHVTSLKSHKYYILFQVWRRKIINCHRIHLQKSNKGDSLKDILLVPRGQEHIDSFEQTPRQYAKHKADYWENEIRENRMKQLSVVQAERSASFTGAHEMQIDLEKCHLLID